MIKNYLPQTKQGTDSWLLYHCDSHADLQRTPGQALIGLFTTSYWNIRFVRKIAEYFQLNLIAQNLLHNPAALYVSTTTQQLIIYNINGKSPCRL